MNGISVRVLKKKNNVYIQERESDYFKEWCIRHEGVKKQEIKKCKEGKTKKRNGMEETHNYLPSPSSQEIYLNGFASSRQNIALLDCKLLGYE